MVIPGGPVWEMVLGSPSVPGEVLKESLPHYHMLGLVNYFHIPMLQAFFKLVSMLHLRDLFKVRDSVSSGHPAFPRAEPD